MYKGPQYFTFTGWKIEEAPEEIEENQEAINELFKKYYPNKEHQDSKQSNVLRSPSLTDDEVLDKCRKDKRHSKFFKLYDIGEWKSFREYNSQSEADLGLCVYLAFYTQDPEQINRIFCKGKLYRPEWDRDSKGLATIKTAISGLTTVWNPKEYKGKKEKAEKPEKIFVHFDEVGDQLLKENHIFSMRDNGQIYRYDSGVYKEKGSEAILGTQIRNKFKSMFIDKWKKINPGFDLPEHIPKATSKYVTEVLEYIRAYTHIDRNEIDINQSRYINYKNGLFDLEKWELIEHTPGIQSIAQTQASFVSSATCPVITKYFKDCKLPDQSVSVLEEFAGYSLTPDVRLQKAVMLYGTGANGKSVFINLLKTILGPDFVSSESLQNLETDKYRVANLYGKRLNAFPDLKDTPLQTNEVFNILTGNDQELIGEKKYQHDFRFKPTTKLLFSANKIPFAYSDNYAYYRRWILIEFPKTFEKEEIDESILDKLTTEEEKSGFIT
jgi:putative DNA primase/helicase